MKRICSLLIAGLIFSACLLYAADFWEKKDYSTWSGDEVSKILKDSPWARRTYVKYVNKPMDPGAMGPGPPPMGNVANMGGGGFGGGGFGGGGFGGGMGSNEPVPIVVRWHSALPVKQAVAILRYKGEVGTSKEAAEMINRQESTYIVGIIGMPKAGPMGNNKDAIKAGSQLILENKPPIKAVEVFTNQDGENTNLYIAFPRYENNKPLISMEDKNVEVLVEIASPFRTTVIKKEFKLKDMQYHGKLEI